MSVINRKNSIGWVLRKRERSNGGKSNMLLIDLEKKRQMQWDSKSGDEETMGK